MATINSEEIRAQRAQLRGVNEHIARLTGDGIVSLLCECASGYCIENRFDEASGVPGDPKPRLSRARTWPSHLAGEDDRNAGDGRYAGLWARTEGG